MRAKWTWQDASPPRLLENLGKYEWVMWRCGDRSKDLVNDELVNENASMTKIIQSAMCVSLKIRCPMV